jgi:hypothetical protein
MCTTKTKFFSLILIINLFLIISVCSCSRSEQRLDSNIEQEEYLELSSYDNVHLMSVEDIYSFGKALNRFGLYVDGNELKYRAKSAEDINISPELFIYIEELIKKEAIKTRTNGGPSDCVAKSLALWGGASYETINAYIVSEYGNDGVPADEVLNVIRHFYPNAQPHYPDTNDVDFSTDVMTTVGVMYTSSQYSLHMVNISDIDSLGNVTYYDAQNNVIDINTTSDYSVFYTKE